MRTTHTHTVQLHEKTVGKRRRLMYTHMHMYVFEFVCVCTYVFMPILKQVFICT